MELEVDRFTEHRIYSNARWTLKNSKLTQIVPIEVTKFSFEPMFKEGDNFRLDGEVYHVCTRELAHKPPNYYAIYYIVKSEYRPPRWIIIGKVEEA